MKKMISLVLALITYCSINYGVEIADKKLMTGNPEYSYQYIVDTVNEYMGAEGNRDADNEMSGILDDIEEVWRDVQG